MAFGGDFNGRLFVLKPLQISQLTAPVKLHVRVLELVRCKVAFKSFWFLCKDTQVLLYYMHGQFIHIYIYACYPSQPQKLISL